MRERGYVALIAVLVIGAVSTAIGVGLLTMGVDSQKSSLVAGEAVQARIAASTCVEEALQVLHDNLLYTGTGNETVGLGSCSYTVTNPGGYTRNISTSGTVGGVTQRVSATVTLGSTITVTSWQEVQ